MVRRGFRNIYPGTSRRVDFFNVHLQSKIIPKVMQFAYGQPLSYFLLRDRTSLSPEAETNTTRGSIQL